MTTFLKVVGQATLDVLGRGLLGLTGYAMGSGLTYLVTGDVTAAVGGGIGGAMALLIAGRVMDRDLAALDERLAADRLADAEARNADLQRRLDERTADCERLMTAPASAPVSDEEFERQMAELFGDLETVGSGEIDMAMFAAIDAPRPASEADKLRKQYERGTLTLAEYEERLAGK